jgi:hypothetical protein
MNSGYNIIYKLTRWVGVHLSSAAPGTGNGCVRLAALDSYSEWKSVYIDYSGRQKAQIDR